MILGGTIILSKHIIKVVYQVKTFRTRIYPLDAALPEGFPVGSTVAIGGSPGTGKTVLVTQIAWEILKQGGGVIYVNLDDSPHAVMELFSNFGWDLTPYINEGRFGIVDCFSFRLGKMKKSLKGVVREVSLENLEAILHDISEALAQLKGDPKVLIIDSIHELMFRYDIPQVLEFVKTVRAVISKGEGVTVILTLHISTDALQELLAHLEYLVDGIILTEIEPNLMEIGIPLKQLMVKKMRGLPTNSYWIPYAIASDGIHGVDPKKLALLVKEKMRRYQELRAVIEGAKSAGEDQSS